LAINAYVFAFASTLAGRIHKTVAIVVYAVAGLGGPGVYCGVVVVAIIARVVAVAVVVYGGHTARYGVGDAAAGIRVAPRRIA
jgi:hypothetical protein